MAYFTFDTAWIVAHMQNSNNEALKEAIRDRLCEMKYFADEAARCAITDFETTCWAWQHDCLDDGHGGIRPRPTANPWPFRD